MTQILRRCPYSDEPTEVSVAGERVTVKAHQVVVWVSLTLYETDDWDSGIPRIPAILDTGHTHNFSIQTDQLVRWAGIKRIDGDRREVSARIRRWQRW
jgi:hypothetical protein